MIRAMRVVGLVCIVALLCGGVRVHPAVEVLEVALAAGVSGRQPDGAFSPPGRCHPWDQAQPPRIDPERHAAVVFWTRVKSVARQELRHTYYRAALQPNEQKATWQEVAAVPLSIEPSASWRTWSKKAMRQGLEGEWKVEITILGRPNAILCAMHFFVLPDAVWQGLTAEPHVRELLCRMAKTSPLSLYRAGQEVLQNRIDRDGDGAATATLLPAWERFIQHAAASDRLFCAGDA